MNPFIELARSPVETLSAAAYALVLVAALLATWYAAGRNLLWLLDRYQAGWRLLPPFWFTARSIALILIVALDLLLIAGIIWTST